MISEVVFGTYHTWRRWNMLMASKKIGSPDVKKSYIDVYGRIDGPIDATELVAGRTLYGNRQLEFSFDIPKKFNPKKAHNEITAAIHGKRMPITVSGIEGCVFNGRCEVSDMRYNDNGSGTFNVRCICNPHPEREDVRYLERITVLYTGGSVPQGTSVNTLNVLVTGFYSDGTSESIRNYSISGQIGVGSNTVTVSYKGKTATFTVIGTATTTDPSTSYFILNVSKLNSADMIA